MDLLTVVQARTGSTRLPGKVLFEIGGRTVLEHVLHRLELCASQIGSVIVATGSHSRDDRIADVCLLAGVDCFRSAEEDVLHRFEMAARKYQPARVLRVTADCPLLDPLLVDRIIEGHDGHITRIAAAPKGLGEEEMIERDALERLWVEAPRTHREHVTTYADGNPDFTIRYLQADEWLSGRNGLRFVLDTPEDWAFLELLYTITDGTLFDLEARRIIEAAEAFVA